MTKLRYIAIGVITAFLAVIIAWNIPTETPAEQARAEQQSNQTRINPEPLLEPDREEEEEEKKRRKQEMKAARYEYFFRLLRNPATNQIPVNLRERELNFARQLPKHTLGGRYAKGTVTTQSQHTPYQWIGVGPQDVGGRTRALGIDQRDPNIIIAGGVSGGIWKSTDGGDSWTMKSDPDQNMSVTYLTQDPTSPDTWYYASGEIIGNSATDQGNRAPYRGTGVFKSTDNGETWTRLPSTEDVDVSYDSPYDYISRIVVSPTTGSVFIASNGFGIYRSTDDGNSWSSPPVLGDANASGQPKYYDVNVGPDGRLVATVSQFGAGSVEPGVYVSVDDGDSWTNVTPSTFPSTHERSVAAFAPSDPSHLYVFSDKGGGSNQGISFHKFTLSEAGDDTLSTEDRSPNIPDFGNPVGGINLQGGYNMLLSVKPDDPNYVLVGGINLFRSEDGFATGPPNEADSTKAKYWIGGYARSNDVSLYENQHPDQHVMAFHPTHPDTVFTGHDGGLSLTESITDSVVSWTYRNEGYVTSQFYTVAMADDTTNNLIGGGAQDNGSPFIEVNENFQQTAISVDASSGDGGYAHFSDSLLFVSSQLGTVIRYDLDQSGTYSATAFVHPSGARNQLFVHPYMIDPNNKGVMYYPGVSSSGTARIWVNTEVDQISNTNNNGTSQGWNAQELGLPNGFIVSTLQVSRRPSDVLYYAASWATPNDKNSEKPKLFRVTDASGEFNQTEISIPDAASGAYIHDIALNPVNSDEAIVVMSNYEITGIYHTTDAGQSWNAVEGNLSDDESGNAGEGPSIRSATIMPTGTSTIYMVGTSVGLFSTQTLDAGNTTWLQESPDGLGNAVTEYVVSRITDGAVAVGSHGRGIFVGEFTGQFSTPGPPSTPQQLTASVSEATVSLSWKTIPEVDKDVYNVYKGSEPNDLTFWKEVTSTSATDDNPGTHTEYYAVSAVDNDGNESMVSRPVAAFRRSRTIDDNWRLVGSPLVTSQGATIPTGATVFSYIGTYDLAEQMEAGRGYWIKNSETDSVDYVGGSTSSRTITLSKGWNLVAGVADTISVDDIQDPDQVLSNTPIKEYANDAYRDAQLIVPTGGYFVHAQTEGQITMQVDTSSAPNKSAGRERIAAVSTKSFDKLTFRTGGSAQTIFISRSKLGREEKQYFLRAPRPPQTLLDVRTGQGFSLADANEEINIATESYPVAVTLETAGDDDKSYRLVGISQGEKTNIDLIPGRAVTISEPFDELRLSGLEGEQLPLTNDLLPNYPNPFNPTTTIAYQLANQSQVTMEVYNILGRKVQTLVNKVQQAGTYRVTFDGASLSSGTYFVRIRAGEFRKVQKMTLIK